MEPFWAKPFVKNKVDRLNLIQSIVFNVAFNTGLNMLVCAPTGAGKTNIALLTVMQTLKSFSTEKDDNNYKIAKEKFKIIYIAPLKALAAEITDKLRTSLSDYKIIVEECTGDTNIPKSVLTKASILVCTPEKWDVMTRMNNENEILENVELLIIDEVHLLNDDRGHVIENIVARYKM